jgi:prepilin-type N-terminal cleavage/methylation domain-containing protein
MKQKAFTLIELLVVVAIIGILAAVGVVAYNGYTASAKKNAVKSNFKLVEKYISAELMKCEIGDDFIFLNSGRYKVSCSHVDPYRMTGAVPWDSQLKKILNPMDTLWGKNNPIMKHDGRPSDPIGDGSIGFIFYSFPSWPGALRVCFATPCSSSDNVLTATINYQ